MNEPLGNRASGSKPPLGRVFTNVRSKSGTAVWEMGYQPSYEAPLTRPEPAAGSASGTGAPATWYIQAAKTNSWLAPTPLTVPSHELTLEILETSPDEVARLVSRAAADRPEEVPPVTPEQILADLQEELSHEIRGSVANFAFDAIAAGRTDVYLWKGGKFDRDFVYELLYALPLDVYRAQEVFRRLHAELLGQLRTQEIAGDWGWLRLEGEDIKVVFPKPGDTVH